MEQFLISVGRLYEAGLQPQLSKLYPAVQYPVSRGTPMISPLIRWEHSKDWFVFPEAHENKNTSERLMEIDMMAKENDFYTGHVIDGRNLFPATGYIFLVWKIFRRMNARELKSVVMENIRFSRATTLPTEGTVQFVVSVQKSSGRFEVVEGGTAIVTGYIRNLEDPSKGTMLKLKLPKSSQGRDLMDLSSRDIYKELRLRGYNYTGAFRSLVSVDNMGTTGKILWAENWVGFMDSMLQMRILPKDTRNLYVPTGIDKIVIDIEKHNEELAHCETESVLPIYAWNDVDIVCAGGVEIQRLKANAIMKRRPLGEPVLERYQFVPHFAAANPPLNLQQVVRMCVHVALENHHSMVVKAVELVDESSDPNSELLAPQLVSILGDLPLITPSLWVLGSEDDTRLSELGPEVQFLSSGLSSDHSALLVVGSNLLSRLEALESVLQALADHGCIITRETNIVNLSTIGLNLQVLVDQTVESERILLLKKVAQHVSPAVVHITEKNFSWLSGLKTALKSTTPPQRVVLVAQGEPLNGIVGLYNSIQKEPGAKLARCFFILDETAPLFDPELPFYRAQLDKDLAVNVYHNAQWGSYRHLLLDSLPTVPAAHAYNNVLVQGDLSTLSWLEGPLDPYKKEEDLIYIYYSSLNFRDIMLSTGKISPDSAAKDRTKQEILQGCEFSGRDSMGRRVVGMGAAGALGTLLKLKSNLVWEVPEHWTLEEAATVPVVYTTVIFALSVRGHMQRGETVLIHAGTGGIGLAAITYCLHHGCTVFTTVGTKEKREFIKHHFPQLTDRHIGNSRDTSFEDLIMRETNGRGVDIVLNSLSEEKLHASIRCLAKFGRFLEIGKFDMAKDNLLGLEMFSRGQSFSSVMLDLALTGGEELCQALRRILEDGIREGSVQPLNRTVYPTSKVEEAFRFMAAAKHMGKILIQIRPEEEDYQVIPKPVVMNVKPRFHCSPDLSYIILGGLGGFGLELADWLVLRGARKLVLTSRKGITTGYQSFRIRIWRSYNTVVHISTADISTEDGVRKLLQETNSIAPVGGIFNLAVVLHDALLENQTEQKFEESAKGKANATRHLDTLSREMCPHLKQFVVFSSVSCGRGNAGQSNYGMSNSVMERVCEARVRDGLPGLAVQWGAIGDVGLVAEMQEEQHELVIGGTLQQNITSCLATLDNFLKQPHPVVSSMVVAEKRTSGTGGSGIVDAITNILGLYDLKTVSTLSALPELGMDSMMAVEIKQVLEREFELFFTQQEIRMLTIARLQELDGEKDDGEYLMENERPDDTRPEERNFLARIIKGSKVASITCYPLPSLCTETCTHTMFMLPGIEGLASMFEPLCRGLTARCVGLQLGYDNPANSIPDMATYLLPHIKREITRGSSVSLLGHSMGGLVALELAAALRADGWQGQVILLDSSPLFIKTLLQEHILKNSSKEENLHLVILWQMLKILDFSQEHDFKKFSADIWNLKTWNDRLEMLLRMTPTDEHSHEYQRIVANSFLTRINAITNYKTHKCVVDAPVVLVRTKESTAQIGDDYGLSEICCANVAVHHCEGDHFSILDHPTTAEVINAALMDVPV